MVRLTLSRHAKRPVTLPDLIRTSLCVSRDCSERRAGLYYNHRHLGSGQGLMAIAVSTVRTFVRTGEVIQESANHRCQKTFVFYKNSIRLNRLRLSHVPVYISQAYSQQHPQPDLSRQRKAESIEVWPVHTNHSTMCSLFQTYMDYLNAEQRIDDPLSHSTEVVL